MKNNFKYSLGLLMFIALIVFSGCMKDDDLEQGPTVTIASMTPDPVYQGDDVTVTGDNLNTVLHVFVGLIEADFTVNGSNLVYTVPLTAEVGLNTITFAMDNKYRVSSEITVDLIPTPVIKSFDAWVPVGGDLVITGTSLDNNTVVTIDGVEATISSNDGSNMVVVVPNVPDDAPLVLEITTDYGTFTEVTPFFARENLIFNGDLSLGEGDEFEGWIKNNGGDGMTSVVGVDAFGGGRSMRVVGAASNPWNTQLGSAPMQLDYEGEYTILFYAKAEAEGAIMRVSQSFWDGNGADYFYGPDVELDTDWKVYSFPLTVTNDLPEHNTVFDMGHTDIPFLIDHMALVPGTLDLSGVVSGPSEELLNGSFEDGLTNWQVLNGTLDISTAEANCGTQSLTATGAGGNPWDVQIASDPMMLEVGTMYEMGFWVKAAGPDGVMRASVSRWASGQSDDFFYTPDIAVTEEWTYYSYIFEAMPTSTGDYNMVMDFGSTTQTFFVDGVSMKEYVPGENLYANTGFEDGLNNWSVLNGTLEGTSAEAYEGSSCLTATGAGGNPWDVQIASDAVALEVDAQYKLSFWAKAAGPDGVMRASVSRWASGQSDDFFYTPDITVGEDWTYYAFVFTAMPTSTGDHHIVLDFGSTTQTFFVDDVKLYEAGLDCE
ncbi:MAG: hypothetical protein DWQ02_12465 [Bacteroidetes bacterium]|nr:MAG: hypothetical protein DWQ02_12465 [Bacteroidota bacterium]